MIQVPMGIYYMRVKIGDEDQTFPLMGGFSN